MPRASSARTRASRGRQAKRREDQDDEIPEVYQEMLAEAEARDPDGLSNDRPIKKRKVEEKDTTSATPQLASQEGQYPAQSEGSVQPVQTVYDSPSSDESDMEWEEIDLQQPPSVLTHTPTDPGRDDTPLQITLDKHDDQKRKAVPRRKPITGAERKLRLDIHKVHLLCLLRHAQIRNLWCNDEEVQKFLKRMLSRQTISLLNPSEDKPQYSRSTTFVDGLNQASDAFMRRFQVTRPGIKRAHWVEDSVSLRNKVEQILADAEVTLSKADFQKQAKELQGSRDFGAQLFCALLRSAAVEARLVCSMQPLPFHGATMNATPAKASPQAIVISSDDHETSTDEQTEISTSQKLPSRSRRLGRPQFKPSRPPKTFVSNARPISRESSYPVYWVEAFNEAVQKWVPIDPLVTKSLAKSFKFEPPSSDLYNCMSYVVAFEEDASARDVTRRYSKAFNAKTRKLRVESTKNGEKWWSRALQIYEKPFLEDRDEVEISELTAKTAAEPMPRNVQDFKGHPIYALERHLRRNEVVFPKRVIGQVSLGKSGSKNQVLEPVYRRSDVHTLRSADKWYRLGRDIKVGEQPLKRVQASRNKAVDINEDEDDELAAETPLYSYAQTELYTPPPVVQGKIPKNVYGNLDIYVPTMVPPGGIHVNRPDAAHAARILGIDYADAVTGFDFKGRHGTAILQGVVIACEYYEALEEVLQCLEDEKLQAALDEKSAESLRLWKRFLLRLRIAERVKEYAIEGDDEDGDYKADTDLSDDDPADPEEFGGGFITDPDQAIASPPKMNRERFTPPESLPLHTNEPDIPPGEEDFLGGGFLPEESENTMISSLQSREPPRPANRNGPAEHPHYELIVIPNDNSNTTNRLASEKEVKPSDTQVLESEPNAIIATNDGKQHRKGSFEAPITVDSSTAADSKPASVEAISQPASQSHSRIQSPEASEKETGSNDEGSLLSEDPDDEDAIPEWLM